MNFNKLVAKDLEDNSIYLAKVEKGDDSFDFGETIDQMKGEYLLKQQKPQILKWLKDHDYYYIEDKYEIFFNKKTELVEINARDSVYLNVEFNSLPKYIRFNIVLGKFYCDNTQIKPRKNGNPRVITGE